MYLRRRLNTVLLQWFLLLVVFAGSVWAVALPGIRRDLHEDRLLLARTVAHSIDGMLESSIQSLGRLAADIPADPSTAASRIRPFRFESIFADAIYVIESDGRVVASDPSHVEPIDRAWLRDRELVSSVIHKAGDSGGAVVAIVQPIRRDDHSSYLVVEMRLANSRLRAFLSGLEPTGGLRIDVVDDAGVVISGDGDEPVDASIRAPLRVAAWSVVVQESTTQVSGFITTGQGLALTGVVLAFMGVLLARTLSRSVVSPIRQLSRQAEAMRSGNLAAPITVTGDHEIKVLARTLDDARARLAAMVAELQAFNQRLEEQVAARTRVIVQQDEQRKVLLRRMMGATEDERRRLARELHDEIAQLLTVIQLSLHNMHVDTPEMARANALLVQTQEEIHRIIHDLRPSMLDDLGLAAAMRSYADDHLRKHGLNVSLEIEEGLSTSPEIETALFRIYQELLTNILRHASAEHVSIEVYRRDRKLVLAVEDDGCGFDPDAKSDGAGLTGMRERAALVNGSIRFDSEVDLGTHVVLEIPLQ